MCIRYIFSYFLYIRSSCFLSFFLIPLILLFIKQKIFLLHMLTYLQIQKMWVILIHLENSTKNNLSLIIDIKSKTMLLRSKLKERWKMLLLLGAIWILIIFPIPFLPAWGYPIDETSLRTLMIITAVISIPFTLLAIFMNDGNREHSTY